MKVKQFIIAGLSGVSVALCAVNANAHSVCNSVDECRQLIAASQTLISAAQARIQELQPALQLGSIVRNADGSVRKMNFSQAQKYCSNRGGLPTARHLALVLNPGGVSATEREGFKLIQSWFGESFYYNNQSYVGDKEGDQWFWTSSVNNEYHPYAFHVNFGVYANSGHPYHAAVRCLFQ